MRTGFLALTVAAALALFCRHAAAEDAAAKDLLENPGFEADAVGAIGRVPKGWARCYGAKAPLEIVEDSRPGSEGDKCVKFDTNEKSRRTGVISKLVPIDPALPLDVSVWMNDGGDMTVKRTPYVGVAMYDAARKPIILKEGTKVNYRYVNFKKQAGWQRISRRFTPFDENAKGVQEYYQIPTNAAFIELRIFADNYPWPVWIDDAAVTQPKPAAK